MTEDQYTVEVEMHDLRRSTFHKPRPHYYIHLHADGGASFVFADSTSKYRAEGVAEFVRDNPHVAAAILADYERGPA